MRYELIFPILMVIGAVGSLIESIISHRGIGTNLQWLGAALLYTGLSIRNTQ